MTQQYLALVSQAQAGRIDIAVERFTLDQVADAWSSTVKAVICFQEDDR
jgi:hypothetical protein